MGRANTASARNFQRQREYVIQHATGSPTTSEYGGNQGRQPDGEPECLPIHQHFPLNAFTR